MIRLATLFSGIGAIEQAFLKQNIEHKIVFACDNGERFLPKTVEEIKALCDKIGIKYEDENTLLNETDIATKYLTETDMIDMEKGLIVYGKENLNKLLEDFYKDFDDEKAKKLLEDLKKENITQKERQKSFEQLIIKSKKILRNMESNLELVSENDLKIILEKIEEVDSEYIGD